jgi:enoyl-[acyl-carrier-protein] reductase (NADH)
VHHQCIIVARSLESRPSYASRRSNGRPTRAPIEELVDIMDVGSACVYLATPFARRITGGTVYVDGGVHLMA